MRRRVLASAPSVALISFQWPSAARRLSPNFTYLQLLAPNYANLQLVSFHHELQLPKPSPTPDASPCPAAQLPIAPDNSRQSPTKSGLIASYRDLSGPIGSENIFGTP